MAIFIAYNHSGPGHYDATRGEEHYIYCCNDIGFLSGTNSTEEIMRKSVMNYGGAPPYCHHGQYSNLVIKITFFSCLAKTTIHFHFLVKKSLVNTVT